MKIINTSIYSWIQNYDRYLSGMVPLYITHTHSVVAAGFRYEVDGFETRESEIFLTLPDRAEGPPKFLYSVYRVSFPGVKRLGMGVYTDIFLVPRLKNTVLPLPLPPPPPVRFPSLDRDKLYFTSSNGLPSPNLYLKKTGFSETSVKL
jgi:hypothetical protein